MNVIFWYIIGGALFAFVIIGALAALALSGRIAEAEEAYERERKERGKKEARS